VGVLKKGLTEELEARLPALALEQAERIANVESEHTALTDALLAQVAEVAGLDTTGGAQTMAALTAREAALLDAHRRAERARDEAAAAASAHAERLAAQLASVGARTLADFQRVGEQLASTEAQARAADSTALLAEAEVQAAKEQLTELEAAVELQAVKRAALAAEAKV